MRKFLIAILALSLSAGLAAQTVTGVFGGGGGTATDATARARADTAVEAAEANRALIGKMMRKAGDSVAADEEVFVEVGGKLLNWVNRTPVALIIPATPTRASMIAAQFSLLSSSASSTVPIRTAIRAAASATDTDVPSEKAVRTALDALGVPTLRLANGAVAAAGGVYVQAVGDTHIAPVLAAGERTIVVNLQSGGGAIETTYLHDGVSQSTVTSLSSSAVFANGTVKDVTDRVATARAWSPATVSDVLRDNDTARFKHYKSGETIDFDALHTGANTRAIRMFSFTTGTELTNAPQAGAALGVLGHGMYIGDTDNGQQFVYFLKDALDRETEYYRERSGGNWLAWSAVSSDGWQLSRDDMQISSGMHIVIADTHRVHFLASDRARAIRLIPSGDWSKVGAITPGNNWTFDGDFPKSGRQEVLLVPAPVADVWRVSAVIPPPAKTVFINRSSSTTGAEPTAAEYPDPQVSDVVAVLLSDNTVEFWRRDATAWALANAIAATSSAVEPEPRGGLLTAGARGSFVTFGSIQIGVTPSGNASMVVRSASASTLPIAFTTWISYDNASSAAITLNDSAGVGKSLQSTWNFSSVGMVQQALIHDKTNNRFYRVMMVVQSGHANQWFWCEEIGR